MEVGTQALAAIQGCLSDLTIQRSLDVAIGVENRCALQKRGVDSHYAFAICLFKNPLIGEKHRYSNSE